MNEVVSPRQNKVWFQRGNKKSVGGTISFHDDRVDFVPKRGRTVSLYFDKVTSASVSASYPGNEQDVALTYADSPTEYRRFRWNAEVSSLLSERLSVPLATASPLALPPVANPYEKRKPMDSDSKMFLGLLVGGFLFACVYGWFTVSKDAPPDPATTTTIAEAKELRPMSELDQTCREIIEAFDRATTEQGQWVWTVQWDKNYCPGSLADYHP